MKKEIAGNLQALNGYFYQVAFCQLPDDGRTGHKAQALIGQEKIFQRFSTTQTDFYG